MPSPLAIRQLTFADLDAVEAIEQCTDTDPWTRSQLAAEISPPCIALGAFAEMELVGFTIASRLGAACHIDNLAVAPSRQRSGIAAALLEELLDATPYASGHVAETRASNSAAISLAARFGFEVRTTVNGYYANPDEDARVLWREPADV